MEKNTVTPAATAAPAVAAEEKKPKHAPIKSKPEAWKDYELKSELPGKFEWRGVTYIASELTDIELARLAADNAFGHIVKK